VNGGNRAANRPFELWRAPSPPPLGTAAACWFVPLFGARSAETVGEGSVQTGSQEARHGGNLVAKRRRLGCRPDSSRCQRLVWLPFRAAGPGAAAAAPTGWARAGRPSPCATIPTGVYQRLREAIAAAPLPRSAAVLLAMRRELCSLGSQRRQRRRAPSWLPTPRLPTTPAPWPAGAGPWQVAAPARWGARSRPAGEGAGAVTVTDAIWITIPIKKKKKHPSGPALESGQQPGALAGAFCPWWSSMRPFLPLVPWRRGRFTDPVAGRSRQSDRDPS